MKKLMLSLVTACSFATAILPVAYADLSGMNNPYRLNKNFESRFDKMPLSGGMKEGYGYPSYYWPNNKGGIAQRWNHPNPQHFKYKSPTLQQLRSMSKANINQLSPAEKYDIFMGSYDYPTVRRAWSQTAPHHSMWYGICHGMSPVALHYPEPKTVTVTNRDGIEITFFSSDVAGLMGYYYAKVTTLGIVQIGRSCSLGFSVTGACQDVEAAAFHILLGNQLGLTQNGFIADIDRRREKWNHVAYKFNSQVVSREKNEKGQRVRVKTTVFYSGSPKAPSMTEFLDSPLFVTHEKNYEYYLQLDFSGRIVGSKWISWDRPDYLWFHPKDQFTGYWNGLNQLFQSRHQL